MNGLNPLIVVLLAIGLSVPLKVMANPWVNLPLPQQRDSMKVAINKLGKKDLKEIIALAKQLHQIADILKDDRAAAYAIRQLAWGYYQGGDFIETIRYYLELEQLCRRMGDTEGIGRANFYIGKLFVRAHKYDEGIKYFKQAGAHYATAEKYDKVRLAQYQMAQTYLFKKEPEVAALLLQETLNSCSPERREEQSIIYTLLGWAAKDQGDYQAARYNYKKSLTVLGGNRRSAEKRAIKDNNIGECFLLERRYDSATFYLERALATKVTLNDSEFSLSTVVLLADIDYRRGLYAKAASRLEEGLAAVDTDKLSDYVDEALDLVARVVQHTPKDVSLPPTLLERSMQSLRQQMFALQKVKEESDKLKIDVGRDLYVQEMQKQQARASLLSQQYNFENARNMLSRWIVVLACLTVIGLGVAYVQRLRNTKVQKDKEDFVRQQMQTYDESILRMLVLRAKQEEIKDRLKRDFGFEDLDFSGETDE